MRVQLPLPQELPLMPPPLLAEPVPLAPVVQGNNGNNSQMQAAVGPPLAQPSFFGGGSVFHAMVAEVEENMNVDMLAQQNPMYGTLVCNQGCKGD